MPIILTQAEKDALALLSDDNATGNRTGFQLDSNGDGAPDSNVYTDVMPIQNWNEIAPPGSEFDIKYKNGFQAGMAPLVRRLGPIGFQAYQAGALFSGAGIISESTLLTSTTRMSVARIAQITANFSCYTDSFGTTPFDITRVDFWVNVNGVNTNKYRLALGKPIVDITYGYLPVHSMATGSWIVTLPAGAVTIALKAERGAGPGRIFLNHDDFASLSAIG